MLKHWNIYNRAAADAPSLETFEVDLDCTLCKPGLVEGDHDRNRVGTRWPLEVTSNPNHSTTLSFSVQKSCSLLTLQGFSAPWGKGGYAEQSLAQFWLGPGRAFLYSYCAYFGKQGPRTLPKAVLMYFPPLKGRGV